MHWINQIEIELRTAEAPLAREMSERVSRMRETRIAPILDRVCSDLSDNPALERIDRLEVGLGALPAEGFDDEFAARFEATLRAALSAALRRRPPHGDQSAAASLDLLETFALTGNLPWWADARDRDVVAHHFARAGGEVRERLIALLRRIADDPPALERIARACMVEVLFAPPGDDRKAKGSREPIALTARRELLLTLTGHEAETAAVKPPELRVTADRGAGRGAVIEPASSSRVVAHQGGALETDSSKAVTDKRVSDGVKAPAGQEDLDERRRPPDHGASAGIESGRAVSGEAAGPTRRFAVPTGQETFHQPERTARAQLPADQRSEPTGSRQHRRLIDETEPRAQLPIVAPGHLEAPRPASASPTAHEPHRRSEAPVAPPPVMPPSAASIRARRAALARLDELYVDDAGLVILWPFLERFFVRLGLVHEEERRFLGEGAALQAIALLEALATGDLDPPEFRVPLPKLLCGRELESDFQLERPLTPEQISEAELLLTAAIDRAKVLGELSIQGFRATFLQRRGALTTRDGAWLLRVERQAHDVLLDRFPWSWGWVKLPWMPHPMQVEW